MQKEFTIQELMEYLPDKPSIHTVYKWVSEDKIPYKKYGKKLFFEKQQIDLWNESGRKKEIIR